MTSQMLSIDAYDLPTFSSLTITVAFNTHTQTQYCIHTNPTHRLYKNIVYKEPTVHVYEDYPSYINHNLYGLDYLLLFITFIYSPIHIYEPNIHYRTRKLYYTK